MYDLDENISESNLESFQERTFDHRPMKQKDLGKKR